MKGYIILTLNLKIINHFLEFLGLKCVFPCLNYTQSSVWFL